MKDYVEYPKEHREPILQFDGDPVSSRIAFINDKLKEEPIMTKPEFVTYMIQHDEDFPNLSPIDLTEAEQILSMIDPKEMSVPAITPEEFLTLYNETLQDSCVMEE